METRNRATRLALEFCTAALCGYLSFVEAKNGNNTLSTAYTFVAGLLSFDTINNAVKIAYGNTRFVPLFNRFKKTGEPMQKMLENDDHMFISDDELLVLEEVPEKVQVWDDDDLVPG